METVVVEGDDPWEGDLWSEGRIEFTTSVVNMQPPDTG
jgi:hypothetical protein